MSRNRIALVSTYFHHQRYLVITGGAYAKGLPAGCAAHTDVELRQRSGSFDAHDKSTQAPPQRACKQQHRLP